MLSKLAKLGRSMRVWAVAVSCLSASCATTSGPPPQMSIGAKLTHLEPVGQTPATQKHGKVTITVAPVAFDTVKTTVCSYERIGPQIFQTIPAGVSEETHTQLEEEKFKILSVQPTELSFLVTIRNQMDRVFRGSDAVVQFTADERVQGVEQSNYIDLLNALIPPGRETQIRIRGPSIRALTDNSTVGVQLFDVVTAIDSAGNIVNRDNFEWYFTVHEETIRRTLETIEGRRTVWIPDAQAKALLAEGLENPSVLPVRIVRPDGTPLRTVNPTECYEDL